MVWRMSSIANPNLDDEISSELIQDFSGGEDSFKRATLLDPNQCQHLLNIIVRDNFEARTRMGADAIPTPQTPPIVGATAVRALRYFDTGGSTTFRQMLAAVDVGGVPKFLKFEANAWTDLSGSYAPSAPDTRVAMEQGVDKVLICDGVSPVIYDGTNFAATGTGTAANDVPQGATILCWHTARMFAAGVATAGDTLWVSDILDFTDGHWSTATRSFRVGVGDGDNIIGMGSMQGITLAVMKQNSIWLVNTDPTGEASAPLTINGFTAAATAENIATDIGLVGRDAWCHYANDILFFAQDGVRSIQRMQAAAGQWQLTSPLSQPIQPYIDRVNKSAWQNIVATKYMEFAFFFVPLDNSLVNNYVLVYNGRLQKWMGVWTTAMCLPANSNLNGLCVEVTRFNGLPHLVWGTSNGLVNQWKDDRGLEDDTTYLDNGIGYPSQVWPRSFQFQEVITNKTGNNVIVRFVAGNASVNFSWVIDDVIARTWTGSFSPTGDILGIGTLPFLLQSDAPSTLPNGIRGLQDFYEAYLRIETQTGWFWLRSVAATAFVNPLQEVYT